LPLRDHPFMPRVAPNVRMPWRLCVTDEVAA
jgi:hypothetical protein